MGYMGNESRAGVWVGNFSVLFYVVIDANSETHPDLEDKNAIDGAL